MNGLGCFRAVYLRPYRKGLGPEFRLRLFDTLTGPANRRLAYTFEMKAPGEKAYAELFKGDQFRPSPMHADDSDATVAALLGFLTLRPGDTDSEYFADYSAEQLSYAERYAETLAAEVYYRFGEGRKERETPVRAT